MAHMHDHVGEHTTGQRDAIAPASIGAATQQALDGFDEVANGLEVKVDGEWRGVEVSS